MVKLLQDKVGSRLSSYFKKSLFYLCAEKKDKEGLRLAYVVGSSDISTSVIDKACKLAADPDNREIEIFIRQLPPMSPGRENGFEYVNYLLQKCPTVFLSDFKGLLFRYYAVKEDLETLEFLLKHSGGYVRNWDRKWALLIAQERHNLEISSYISANLLSIEIDIAQIGAELFVPAITPAYGIQRRVGWGSLRADTTEQMTPSIAKKTSYQ